MHVFIICCVIHFESSRMGKTVINITVSKNATKCVWLTGFIHSWSMVHFDRERKTKKTADVSSRPYRSGRARHCNRPATHHWPLSRSTATFDRNRPGRSYDCPTINLSRRRHVRETRLRERDGPNVFEPSRWALGPVHHGVLVSERYVSLGRYITTTVTDVRPGVLRGDERQISRTACPCVGPRAILSYQSRQVDRLVGRGRGRTQKQNENYKKRSARRVCQCVTTVRRRRVVCKTTSIRCTRVAPKTPVRT